MMGKTSKAEREGHLRRCVAYHEAGHAVVAIRLDRKFRHVTIEPGDGSLGHVLHEKFSRSFRPDVSIGPKARETIDDHVLISMAGSAAESRFLGRRTWNGAGQDLHNSIGLGSYLYDNEVLGYYIPFMRARADSLIRSSTIWAQVEAVATALLEHRALDSARVREICRDVIIDGSRIHELARESLARDAIEQAALAKEIGA